MLLLRPNGEAGDRGERLIHEILRHVRLDVFHIEGAIAIDEVLDSLQLGSGSVKTAHSG